MGVVTRPRSVNLICAALAGRAEWLKEARNQMERALGPVDLESDLWPFDSTDYYEPEMGPGLLRVIYSFRDLIAPDNLIAAKHATNRIEKGLAGMWADAPKRPVNLDPGYVSLGKLVLATTKDYAHRVYLGGGIYGECTLRWREGAFEPWEWTYPDYCSEPYRAFLAEVRSLYKEKLRSLEGPEC